MKGYTGKVLFVDLTTGNINVQQIGDEVYENLLSGVGLGAYFLYNNIPQGADPLGPDNVLGFVSGLLTGTGSVMTGRWLAVCKSPLTGGWGDANGGGDFSPAIKQCGYDGIFFKGISGKPVYLYVDNKVTQLKDASHVWGKDAVEAEETLEKENWNMKKPSIAVIGQAAEKLSFISGICNDKGRIAARSGVGAVMGSKKLKAVVLAGTKLIKCEKPEAVKAISKEFSDKVRKSNLPGIFKGGILPVLSRLTAKQKVFSAANGMTVVSMYKKFGTGMGNTFGIPNGDSPLKNWGGSVVDYNKSYYKNINPDKVTKREEKKYHCYSCVIGCGGVCGISDISKGEFSHTHKPEYETVCAFGGLLMNKNLESIFYINELLNRAGMDTISAGNTVAYAIECYVNGLLTIKDTDGLELIWGNSEAIVSLVKKMITREGIGDILADGVKVAVSKLGEHTAKYAMHAGGQEPGMHDARLDPMLGIHYSADPTPGRHTIGAGTYYNMMHLWDVVSWAPKVKNKTPKSEEYRATDEVGMKSVVGSCIKQVVDGSGGCLFAMITGIENWRLFDYLNDATGWGKTPDEYMEMGKRMQTLRQMFNIREGIAPLSCRIQDRMAGVPPLKEGALSGKTIPIEDMMRKHWKHFGWDADTGVPTTETIVKLGLDKLVTGVENE
ncbi:MAG TPA: aldehyde ferredoxin oxidoreductase C-terminal domain-containing protein [Desulfosporosinus sp.]|nr:aldehyde ferredoxin oxidoreductase C-terminal domain-containing protein [Desulfosporosinus sp.]